MVPSGACCSRHRVVYGRQPQGLIGCLGHQGVSTFFHAACTAHRADTVSRQLHALVRAGAGRDIGFLSPCSLVLPTPLSLPFHQLRKGPQLPRHVGAHHPEHHLGRPLRFHGGKGARVARLPSL